MVEKDGAWINDAKIAAGRDSNGNTIPLKCDADGTLDIDLVASIPIDVLPASVFPVSQSGVWTVGVDNFPDVQKTQPWPLSIRAEYSGANLLIYFADALPGTLSSAASWRIRKLSYDGNGNFTTLGWPDANTSFSYIWDNRTTYTYS